MLALGFKRPFIWVLCYLYIDIVAPQAVSWGFLAIVPTSLIGFALAFGGWILFDRKDDARFHFRQAILLFLLIYCGYTTLTADFPVEAAGKWSWVWKALVFAIFLPLTLRTRLRIEAVILTMVLSVATIVVGGGIKTALGGGGYGVLRLLVDNNTGLYEGSIISCFAIAVIPLILWLVKHGTIFPDEWRTRAFAAALIFACTLMPIGTQARTGLLCLGFLCALILRTTKRRFLYMGLMAVAVAIAVPFLPQSFTDRMSTIENHKADESASTRIAVWKWTLDYVKHNPVGGGFEVYLGNDLRYETVESEEAGSTTLVETQTVTDHGRAFHSSYFEMLGEQGYLGLLLWLLLHATGVLQMELVRRRWKDRTGEDERWVAPLAVALQQANLVYLLGAAFVGIAYQPLILMIVGVQCGLWTYLRRIETPAPRIARGAREMTPVGPAAT